MLYRYLADLVLVLHLAYVLFALLGALFVIRWRWLAWIHIPLALWAVVVEWTGWMCPLTPLEHWLRLQGGMTAEEIGFIEQYFLPLLYPPPLTRPVQMILGSVVLGANLLIYGWIIRMRLGEKD